MLSTARKALHHGPGTSIIRVEVAAYVRDAREKATPPHLVLARFGFHMARMLNITALAPVLVGLRLLHMQGKPDKVTPPHLVLVGARFGFQVVEQHAQHVADRALHRGSGRLVYALAPPPIRCLAPPRSRQRSRL